MGACLKKHVDTFKVIQQLEAGEYSAVIHEIDFQDVNPVGKDASGRTPFGVACKKGQTEVVKHFLDGPHGDRIKELDMSKGLFQNCVGTTNGELIQMLLSKDRAVIADIHYFDPNTIGTCMHALVRKNATLNTQQLAEKAMAVGVLCKAGCNLGHENVKSETALDVAMTSEYERGASEIIKGGGDLMHVTRYMKQSKLNSENWVPNSLLASFAFKHPLYLKKIKKQFHDEFDPDGSGELDRKELLRFIAFHVKLAFKNGQKPVREFDDDGSLEISDIMRLLETRCQDYLSQYHVLDEDQSGTYGWAELEPIIRGFYQNMWKATRKEENGKDEWLDATEEKELQAKYKKIRDSIRTVRQGDAKTAMEHRRDQGAKSVKGKIKGIKSGRVKPVSLAQVRTSGPVAHDLPEGWEAHTAPNGKQYYHQLSTGKTSWTKPR
jgi:hypothetical protein|eukprot:g8291.t1